MSKARNIADLGSNDVLDTHTNGVTVTGSLTAEAAVLSGTSPVLSYSDTDNSITAQIGSGTSDFNIATTSAHNLDIRTNNTRRMIVSANGDITMYKDDGSTAGMTFDASSGWVGIGTSSIPNRNLEIVDLDTSRTQVDLGLKTVTNGTSAIFFADTDDTNIGGIRYFHSSNDLEFRTNDSEAMRMTSDGKLKLRTSDNLGNINTHPTYNTEGAYINGFVNGGGAGPYPRYLDLAAVGDSSWGGIIRFLSNDNSNNTAVERMRVDAAGNVGINHQSPAGYLDIRGNGTTNDRMLNINTTGVGGGQTGNFYGAKIHAQSNNSSSDTYGTYITGFQGVGNHYAGLYSSNTSTTNSHARAIGVWGDVLSNSAAVHHGPSNSNYHIQAGVFALARTTSASTNSVNSALVARNLSSNGNTAYGAYIETVAGATNPIPLSVRHAGSEKLKVNASGHVTTPDQPYVFVEKNAAQTLTSNENPITFEVSNYNSGNHFNLSTNTFTAPVAGRYAVNFVASCTVNADHVYNAVYINYNGTPYNQVRARVSPSVDTANEWSSFTISAIIYMAANDSFTLRGYSNHTTIGPTLNSSETNLMITLLG